MTRCGEGFDRLSASLDGALGHAEQERTDAHLAACVECRERLRSLRVLKHAVARLPSRETPPGAVRAHVEALVYRGPGSARSRLARSTALAAGLLVTTAALVAAWRAHHRPSSQLAEEVAADHLHSLPEAMPAEVVTDDPGGVIRFFSGRVPFPPVAPRLPGARLIGGRLCKIRDRRVQLLFYRSGTDATVSLFVSDRALGPDGCREARGLQVCSKRAAPLTLLAVAGGEAHEIRSLLEGASF